MKQVWRCDFCHETDVEKGVIEEHELTCAFNPLTWSCNTCKHYKFSIHGYPEICDKQFVGFYDVMDGDAECPVYEEEVWKQKLKHLHR